MNELFVFAALVGAMGVVVLLQAADWWVRSSDPGLKPDPYERVVHGFGRTDLRQALRHHAKRLAFGWAPAIFAIAAVLVVVGVVA